MPLSMFVNPADGYTLDGRVEETPGLHPAIRFKYRASAGPALMSEYNRAGQTDEAAAKIMSRQASEFQAENPDGTWTPPARLQPGQALTLHSPIWRAVWNHVVGVVGPHVEQAEKNSDSASD